MMRAGKSIGRLILWIALFFVTACDFLPHSVDIIPHKLTFVLPSGLRDATPEEIKSTLGKNELGGRLFIHDTYNFKVIVIVEPSPAGSSNDFIFSDNYLSKLASKELIKADFDSTSKSALTKMEDSRTIAGTKWAYLETEVENNRYYVTVLGIVGKQQIMITYNTTPYVFDKIMRREISRSINSIH